MLDNLPTPYLLGALFGLFIVYKISYTLHFNAKIRKLGARAPTRTSYAPYGLDLAWDVISHALKDQSYEMWLGMFEKFSPVHYTVEAGVGERVLLTAEPENIKAILATQFKDYGKGEAFHKDWYPFLGNGG